MAGGAQIDLEKVAKEQQIKNSEEMEKILAAIKAKHQPGQLKGEKILTAGGRDGEITSVNGLGKNAGVVKNKPDAANASVQSELTGSKEKVKIKNSGGDETVTKLDVSGCVTKTDMQRIADQSKTKKHTKSGQVDSDKATGKVDLCLTMHFHHQHFSSQWWLKFEFDDQNICCYVTLVISKEEVDNLYFHGSAPKQYNSLPFSAWVTCHTLKRSL